MHADLFRLLSEDEAARAGVDEARARAEARLDLLRKELARQRQARLESLEHQLDATIADIAAGGDREVERRRSARDARLRDRVREASAHVDECAEAWAAIVRTGRSPGGGR